MVAWHANENARALFTISLDVNLRPFKTEFWKVIIPNQKEPRQKNMLID
jgi:hypothetical protein